MSELENKGKWKKELADYNRQIGNHLTSLRESKKIPQQVVADQIYADKYKKYMVENGRTTVDAEVLMAYSKALKVPIMRLLDIKTDVDAELHDYLPRVSPQFRQIAIDVLNALYMSYQRTTIDVNKSASSEQGRARPDFTAIHDQTVFKGFNDNYDNTEYEPSKTVSTPTRYVLLDHAQIERLKNGSLKTNMEQIFDMAQAAQASIESALKSTDE